MACSAERVLFLPSLIAYLAGKVWIFASLAQHILLEGHILLVESDFCTLLQHLLLVECGFLPL